MTATSSLRTPAELVAAQSWRRTIGCAALEQVAARYAVAITPAMADLIDPSDPHDPIARQFVPDRARTGIAAGGNDAIRSATRRTARSKASFTAIPTACLLKLVNACAVYCRFCFRREMVGPGRGGLSRAALAAALDYIRSHAANLGSDPDRRRSAGAVAAAPQGRDGAACRDRPRQGDPRAHARAGRGARAGHRRRWCARCAATRRRSSCCMPIIRAN